MPRSAQSAKSVVRRMFGSARTIRRPNRTMLDNVPAVGRTLMPGQAMHLLRHTRTGQLISTLRAALAIGVVRAVGNARHQESTHP